MSRRKTHEEFVKEVFDLVGNEYEVISQYKTSKEKIVMRHHICNKDYEVKPSNFLSGKRCPWCNHPTFNIEIAKELASELDMTLLEETYVDSFTRMKYKCNLHPEMGILHTTLQSILGHHKSCTKCRYQKLKDTRRNNVDFDAIRKEFEAKGLTLLSKEYQTITSPLEYICNKHKDNGIQTVTYDNFMKQPYTCRLCSSEHLSEIKTLSNDEFMQRVNELHPSISVHSKYNGRHSLIDCSCNVCNYQWKTRATNLMYISRGGCPNCVGSAGEIRIKNFLDENNIKYTREYTFDDLRGDFNRCLRFDFAIFDTNEKLMMLCEFDGSQHYEPSKFNMQYTEEQALENYEKMQRYDEMKNEYCKSNGIKLLRIPYNRYRNIENILTKELKLCA